MNAGRCGGERRRGGEGNPLLIALGRAEEPDRGGGERPRGGRGHTMLLHCDLVYVAEDALLSTPFVNLALVPEAASASPLPARIGHARPFAMFVLGETIDAPDRPRPGASPTPPCRASRTARRGP